MSEQPLGPREIARNEAAKQAVLFVFGVVTVVVFALVQRKMQQDAIDANDWLPGSSERRMRKALQEAEKWDRIAAYLFRIDLVQLAQKAHQRAEAARAVYERERP